MNNMKKVILGMMALTMLVGSFTISSAQRIKDSTAYRNNLMVYARAMKYNDVDVAKNALYNLININPGNDSLMFSLSYLYYENQEYISSLLVAQDLLKINPNHQAALEVSAVSYENIGATDKALEAYETLYLKNNDVNTLYKIGFLQLELERLSEAKTSAEILLNKKQIEEQILFFPMENNQRQEVPMKASVYNLMGLIEKEQGNTAAAKENFEKALELAPEFKLAKDNLNQLGGE